MKERIAYGFIVGLIAGFLGLWGFQIETLAGSIAFVSAFAITLAVIFALVSEKARERFVAFFTHFWP
jgi:hypothetical protein